MAVLFCLVISAADGAQDPALDRANQAFNDGHFQEAIDNYTVLLKKGQTSAALFYDLGNAWFRLGDLGQAVLNYERALALEPRHAEAQANLRLARDEARSLELEKGWIERYVGFGNSNQYSMAAAVSLWLTFFLVVRLYFQRQRSAKVIALIVILFGLFVGASVATYIMETGANGAALAIVTRKNVDARLATADSAKTVLSLPPGSQIKIVSNRGDWTYAMLPNGLHGWIPATSAEKVRL
jgi:hypothetical protein